MDEEQRQILLRKRINNNAVTMTTFTVRDRTVIATLPTGATVERAIPESGLQLSEVLLMVEQLGVSCIWLADQLTHLEIECVDDQHVAALALLHGDNLVQLVDTVARSNSFMRGILKLVQQYAPNNVDHHVLLSLGRPRLLHPVSDPIPDDHVCVVCLHDAGPTPGDAWVKAEDCTCHSFHLHCMTRWLGNECKVCRTPLLMEQ